MSVTNLLKCAKIMKISNGATAGTSEVDSSIVDMAGYNAVCFVVDLATVVDASVLTLTPQQNTANQTSGMTAITSASCTFTASTSSNTIMVSDVIRPSQRYVRVAFTRTAQNATVNTILAILYQADNVPVTLDTSVLASTLESGN